jgi:hypothetical protein
MPASHQGGPYLTDRTIQKDAGLTTIDATYVTAANPPRIARSESTDVANFSGYAQSDEEEGSLSFDYYTTSVTLSYALIAGNTFSITPEGEVFGAFNVRAEGSSNLVSLKTTDLTSTTKDTIGRVQRISITGRRIVEQYARAGVTF